jgi:hypothetical protein
MSGFWPDHNVARSAFVEEETRVDRHRHLLGEPAVWTRQQGLASLWLSMRGHVGAREFLNAELPAL